jgi:hypothetical protein
LGHIKDAARRHGAQVAGPGVDRNTGDEVGDVCQLGVEPQDDLFPVRDLLSKGLRGATGRGRAWRGCILENNLGPSLENIVRDVQLPVNSEEESDFVLVDLQGVEP